jgi:TPR repeat protein
MFRRLCTLLAATLPLLLPAHASADAQKWIEVRTPHFVIVANTGEGSARDAGWQFEQVRHVFQTLWPWSRAESGRPFVVFALKGERDLKALAPYYWEEGRDGAVGAATSGRDKDYYAMLSGLSLSEDLGTNPYFYAYWGYANRMLDATFPVSLPPWYKRGLSDLFGNTLVRSKDVQVGRLMTTHLKRLGEGQRVPLADLLAADWKSKFVADENWRPMFDAQAWMFCHYLVFGEKGANAPRMNQFAELMRDGRKADEALKEAFGAVKPLEEGYLNYLDRKLFQYGQLKLDLNVKKEAFAVRTLPPAEAAAVRAGFHVAMGRPVEARALIDEARKADAASVPAAEAEALLFDRENKKAEALAAYTRAAEAGSTNYYVHYRRAMLSWQRDAPREAQAQRVKSLEEAVRLNPDFAWAQASLADVLSETDPGERAVAAALKAARLEPSVASHRITLIDALWNASHPEEAKKQAAEALKLPADADERKRIEEWIGFMNSAPDKSVAAVRAEPGAAIEAPRDIAQTMALAEKACATSDLKACVFAATLKINGKDVPRDLPAARQLAQRACDGGEMAGCTALAVAHLNAGTRDGMAQARPLLKKACDAGERGACDIQGQLPK